MGNPFTKSELTRIILCGIVFFLLGAISVVAPKISLSLFSTIVGSEALSYIYSFNSIGLLIFSILIGIGLTKYSPLKFIFWILLLFALIIFSNSLLLQLEAYKKFTATYFIINANIILEAIEFLMWVVAANIFSSLEAKRFLPILYLTNASGVMCGSVSLFLFKIYPVTFLFISLCAVAFIITAAIIRWMDKNQLHPIMADIEESISFKDFIIFISQAKNWLLILIIPTLAYLIFFVSDYQLNVVAQHHFNNIDQLVSFYGLYELMDSTLAFLLVSLIFSQSVKRIGVWYTLAIIFAIMAGCFFVQLIDSQNIYFSTLSRLIIGFFIEVLVMLMVLVYKASKAKYQDVLLVFANNVSVTGGMLLAGLISIFYLHEWIPFNWLIISCNVIAFLSAIYVYFMHDKYVSVLVQGVEDEHFKAFSNQSLDHLRNLKNDQMMRYNFKLAGNQTASLNKISLEMPIEINNLYAIQHFLIILNSLQDPDPNLRIQALKCLKKFKGLEQVLPFARNILNDDDPYVQGYALITLYHLAGNISESKTDIIVSKLFNLKTEWGTTLSLQVIYELSLIKYSPLVITLLQSAENKIRLHAVMAFGKLCLSNPQLDYQHLLPLLSEESPVVANEVVQVLATLAKSDKQRFTDHIFSDDPWIWRNVVSLILEWEMIGEYEHLSQSSINFILRIYENIAAIEVLNANKSDATAVLAQYLVLQNEAILQGIFRVVAKNSRHDQSMTNSLLKELRSIDPHVKSTALELLENLGDPRITKHLLKYFTLENSQQRLTYAQQAWHIEKINCEQAIESTLHSKNEWIRACGVYYLYLTRDRKYESILTKLQKKETSLLVKTYIDKALNFFSKEGGTMASCDLEIEFMDIIVFLKSIDLFKQMSLPTLASIAKYMTQKKYHSGEVVISSGEHVQGIFIIYSGQLQIIKCCEDGKELSLDVVEAGSVVGEQSLFEQQASVEKIIASQESVLLLIKKKDFMHLIQLHPEVCISILNELCRDLRMYQNHVK